MHMAMIIDIFVVLRKLLLKNISIQIIDLWDRTTWENRCRLEPSLPVSSRCQLSVSVSVYVHVCVRGQLCLSPFIEFFLCQV